jgi:hypothetical protein
MCLRLCFGDLGSLPISQRFRMAMAKRSTAPADEDETRGIPQGKEGDGKTRGTAREENRHAKKTVHGKRRMGKRVMDNLQNDFA